MQIEQKIESIILFKNEPVSLAELSKALEEPKEAIIEAIEGLQEFYKNRGIVLVHNGESVALGTHSSNSNLIEELHKKELGDLSKASVETLTIILYKGPVTRREIDYIRGVNSGFILRNLSIRGLIEKSEESTIKGFTYSPSLELLEHLGITKREDLPEFDIVNKKLDNFVKSEEKEDK